MTVTNATLESSLFSGNGVTTAFATGFQFDNEADIQVILRASDGTEAVQTLTTHYTVSGDGNPAGGTVTMVTPPAVGERLRIVRNLSYTQGVDYTEGTAFPAETHEGALDKLTQLTQQLAHELNRAPKLKTTSSNYPAEFPDGGADKAGFIFRWNTPSGTSLEAVNPVDAITGAETTPFSRDLLADASAAEARSTIGVVIGTDVQAYDAQLADVAGLTPSDGNFIVGDGTNFVAESGATARASLGLGTLATQNGTFSGTSSGTNTGDQSLFSTIAVSGQSNVVADSTSDTLTLAAGANITITTNATTDTITISATGGGGGGLANVVEDTTPQLGGDLDLNGNQITSPDGTDQIDIPNGTIDLKTNSTSRADITDSGLRLGGANARVTTILDEDTMSSNSATALATQQSIKAYVDSVAGGKIKQVVTTTKTDTFSTTSTSFTDVTGLTATITPTSASSTILIIATLTVGGVSGTINRATLARSSSAVLLGATAGSRTRVGTTSISSPDALVSSISMSYVDSPATTSATTYSVQISASSSTVYINRANDDADSSGRYRGASTITLFEIGA